MSLFFSASLLGQEHCIFRPYFKATDLYPENDGSLTSVSQLEIFEDSIFVDGISAEIVSKDVFPFDTKDDMLRTMACIYDFYYASENIDGAIEKFTLSENIEGFGSQFTFLKFNDCGDLYYYVVSEYGLYSFSNSIWWDEQILELPFDRSIILDTIEYIDAMNVDSTVELVVIQAPEMETLTEWVLDSTDYFELVVIPAQFDTTEMYVHQESSTCPDATYDTIVTQVLVKESFVDLEVTSPVFEMVTEQVLLSNEVEGAVFFERELIGPETITLQPQRVSVSGYTATDACSDLYFFPCLELEKDTIPKRDTMTGFRYLPCPNDYTTAGKYCYNNDGISSAVYGFRNYHVMSEPPIVKDPIERPSEYKTVMEIEISNKEEIGAECLTVITDTIEVITLAMPATTESIVHPATYELREYENWSSGAEYTVSHNTDPEPITKIGYELGGGLVIAQIEESQPVYWFDCADRQIKMRLLELGLISNLDVSNQDYYQALVDYQFENDLQVGLISKELLSELEVLFGY